MSRRCHVLALLVVTLAACGGQRAWLTDVRARPQRLTNTHETLTRVEAAYGTGHQLAARRSPTSARPIGPAQPYVLVDVGTPIPVVAVSNAALDADQERPYDPAYVTMRDTVRQWSLQLSMPVGFHLYWDAFSENSPILDTDYTFGIDVGARVATRRHQELRLLAGVGHLSTHLGDEYVIGARTQSRLPFDRINVSIWPGRLAAGYRVYGMDGDVAVVDPVRYRVEIIGGVQRSCVPWAGPCGRDGYYQLFPGEADPARVPTIRNATELSLGLEGRHRLRTDRRGPGQAVGTPRTSARLVWSVSADRRRVFPYGDDPAFGGAAFGTSLNALVGVQPRLVARSTLTLGTLYVRAYTGPNPYGQFRNQRRVAMLAVGGMVGVP
jgi:hypothetical protein